MSNVIESLERRQLRRVPNFRAGDRVRVHFQVVEGTRRRTQVFEGVVIKRQGSGVRETFTVRKQSFGVGVERTFPLHSPKIEKLEVAGRGDVRRAKLYYLRGRVGKAARVAEKRWAVADDVLPDAEEPEAVDAEGATAEDAEAEEAPAEDAEGGDAPEVEAEAEAEAGSGDAEPEAPPAADDAAVDHSDTDADEAPAKEDGGGGDGNGDSDSDEEEGSGGDQA